MNEHTHDEDGYLACHACHVESGGFEGDCQQCSDNLDERWRLFRRGEL